MLMPVNPAQAHAWIDRSVETNLPITLNWFLLIAIWLSYLIGSRRIPPATTQCLTFHGASLIAVVITFDSLDGWIENGSAMHMVQHMLILVVIAPLFVLARPLPQWAAASGRACFRLWKPLLRLGRYPIWMGCLQGLVIWFWHAPALYNLALENSWWHLVEHISFALGAGLFWLSILNRRSAVAVPVLLFTLMLTGMLGALLTFSQTPLYADLLDLQDQQLAGLIMWVPGSLPYLIAGTWCSLRWFQKNVRALNPEA